MACPILHSQMNNTRTYPKVCLGDSPSRTISLLVCTFLFFVGNAATSASAQVFRIGEPEHEVRSAIESRFGLLDTSKSVKQMHMNDGSTLYHFGPYPFYGLNGGAGVVIDSGVVSAFTWATGVNSATVPMSEYTRVYHAIGSTYGPTSPKTTLEPQRVVRGWRTDSTHSNLTLDHGHLQFTILKNEVIQPPVEKPKE